MTGPGRRGALRLVARLVALSGLALAGCQSGDGRPSGRGVAQEHDAGGTRVEATAVESGRDADSRPGSARALVDVPEPPGLLALSAVPVEGRAGPGGRPFEVSVPTSGKAGHDRLIGRTTFTISLRSGPLAADPCGACHVPGRPVVGAARVPDAHADVRPLHPSETGARCVTCHAADDVERLALESGERAPLVEAYRLCAQCHAPEVADWAGGAHGKRLDGWRGRRVVMGCADCHDPHRPSLAPRVPYPGPRLPLSERRP